MSLKILQIVRNELLQNKIKSEANLEHLITKEKLSPSNRVNLILNELDVLKNNSLKLTFWEEFINNNIIIPENKEESGNNKN